MKWLKHFDVSSEPKHVTKDIYRDDSNNYFVSTLEDGHETMEKVDFDNLLVAIRQFIISGEWDIKVNAPLVDCDAEFGYEVF